jgi:general secretion pathway protein H
MGSLGLSSRGFTLLELMLGMVVLGVLLSLATVVLPDRNSALLANETARLVKVIETLQLEAMLQQTRTGLLLDPPGYRSSVLNLQSLEWAESNLDILDAHALQSKGLQLSMVEPQITASGENQPAIVFDASGVSDPFKLRLVHTSGISKTVVSDGIQKVLLQ